MAREMSTPPGWKCNLLDAVTQRGSGHTPDKDVEAYWNGGIKWVSLADSSRLDAGYIDETNKEISSLGVAKSSAVLHPPGTVILSRDAGVGKSAILKSEMAVSQHFIAWRCSPDFGLDSWFLYHWLQLHKAEFERQAVGSTIKTIGLPYFKRLKICHPPFQEQRRIAEILSTWDHAIETVEALIANASTQKQALMQFLLTGKKRLPGFSGGWATVTLNNAAQIIVSNVDKKSSDAERAVRLCNYMDVYRSDRIEADMDFMVATAADAQIRKFGLRVGDVLVTKDSETPGDIAIPSYVASTAPDLVCGYHLAIIRPRNGTDGLFLKFYFEHPHTRHFFASRANGATRFGLTIDAIQTAPITLPSYVEQKRIGEVIGAAELEITRLYPIAAALRQEKAALMQQLLTGKRRVKVDFEGEAC